MLKNKIVTGVFFVILIAGFFYAGLKMYAANIAEEKIDTALTGIEDFVKIEYEDASVDLLSKDVHIRGVALLPAKSQQSEKPLKIDEIVIYDIDDKSEVPSFLNAGIYGVEIPVNELGKNEAEYLHSLGFKDRLKLDFSVSYRYQDTDNLFDLTKLSIRGKDIGELSASIKLGNLSLNKTERSGLVSTYPQITIREAELSFENDALFEKVLQARAKQIHKSEDTVREETIKDIEQQLALTKNEYMRTALHALTSFIQNPGKLKVHLSPERPLSIRQLMRFRDPNQLMAALHLSVTNG